MNLKTTKLIKENINKRTHIYQNKISSSNRLNENTPKKIILKQTFHCNYSKNPYIKTPTVHTPNPARFYPLLLAMNKII